LKRPPTLGISNRNIRLSRCLDWPLFNHPVTMRYISEERKPQL